MARNELDEQTSPYLLQHADNPVHWKAWSDSAFEEAQQSQKPILLSIGYAACHWCHVMAHESFEDPDTAQVMNDLFVNIKVDREEHPDVDAIYQKALALLGQHGGWPLTMFLTPDGQPFWGGTYFPKKAAYGRPSFVQALRQINQIYTTQKKDVAQNVQAIKTALQQDAAPKGDGSLDVDLINRCASMIAPSLDVTFGGLRGAPKFPQPVLFDYLWQSAWLNNDNQMFRLVELTLEKMCNGGIYDHVGGGFARYATDQAWLVPHFEKMLYDNALLVSLLCKVWRARPRDLYKKTIQETLDWALKEMKIPLGDGFALASALDADSEGIEGKFYVWSETEIDEILGKDSALFKSHYDVSASGNWEGNNILQRLSDLQSPDTERTLKACLNKLYDVRKDRIWPQQDDKILLDWNALMIKALCEAGLIFNQAHWIDSAQTIFRTLLNELSSDQGLHHSRGATRLGQPALLEDYANLCAAALALYECTGENDYLKRAEDWVQHLDQTFFTPELGGYKMKATPSIKSLDLDMLPIQDNATPSGNGTMAHVLCELFHLTGKISYQQRLDQMTDCFGTADPNDVFNMPGFVSALQKFENLALFTISGNSQDKIYKELKHMIILSYSPYRKILLVDEMTPFDQAHPLTGTLSAGPAPQVIRCQLGQCSKPATTPKELAELIDN